jgi:hypothetical protein
VPSLGTAAPLSIIGTHDQSISVTPCPNRNCKSERVVVLRATEHLLFVLAIVSSFALAVVQVFAVILSVAKDPDEFDAPLPLESFNQRQLRLWRTYLADQKPAA